MKKLIAAATLFALMGCSNSGQKEQILAQCRLNAFGPEGMTFRKNAMADPKEVSTPTDSNAAYEDFIETCMQSKGLYLVPMYFKNHFGNSVAGCWLDDGKAPIPVPNENNAACYETH